MKKVAAIHIPFIFIILILGIRYAVTQQFTFFFLIWNVWLAYIPYYIADKLVLNKQNLSSLKLYTGLALWWLFLPNAPYMITDLIHLKIVKTSIVWLDMVLLYMASISGLIYTFFSLVLIKKLLSKSLSHQKLVLFISVVLLSCGFGIYLGRIERFNSWDLIFRPFSSVNQIFSIFFSANTWSQAWQYSLLYGFLLLTLYFVFDNLKWHYHEKNESF